MPSKFSGKNKKQLVPASREPNGRHQRQWGDKKRESTRSVVLNQPHRKGDDPKRPDPRRATPIGRLFADRKIRAPGITQGALELAAEEYQRIHGNYRRALDSRRPLAVAAAGTNRELTEAMADRFEEEYNEARKVLKDAGLLVEKAVIAVIEDGQPTDDVNDYLPWVIPALGRGLATLVRHFGWVR